MSEISCTPVVETHRPPRFPNNPPRHHHPPRSTYRSPSRIGPSTAVLFWPVRSIANMISEIPRTAAGETHRPSHRPNYPIRHIARPVGAGHRPPAFLPVRSIADMISDMSCARWGNASAAALSRLPVRHIGRPVGAAHRPPAFLSVRPIASMISGISWTAAGETHQLPRCADYSFRLIGNQVGAGHQPPAFCQFDLSKT